jgi:hypothetical protein
VAAARLFGKRAALGICGAVSVWFIAASVAQITPAVFGAGVVPLAAGGDRERECAEGLRALVGDASAPPAIGAQQALARACGGSPAGLDAWAALERLQMAQEQLKGSDPASVAELRRELSAHLPPEMR